MSDSFDIYEWPSSALGKKLAKLEGTLQCPICSEMYLNPHTLPCGHTYCSHCIRKHFDRAFNPSNTSDQCPVCKEKCEACHLKPNRNLDAVILAYKDARPSLLYEISLDVNSNYTGRLSTDACSKRYNSPILIKRLSYKSFHGKSKKYVRDSIEALCSHSKVTPCLDGDQDELERYYRELIHLNNAQIGSTEPLSFNDVVIDINRSQSFKRKEAKKNTFAKAQAEKMIKGELSIGVQRNFSLLAQQVRKNMKRQKDSQLLTASSKCGSGTSSNSNSAGSSSSSSSSGSIDVNEDQEISDDTEVGEYSEGYWRILMSERLGRPFFYNTLTKIGQFSIPEEFSFAAADQEKERQVVVESSDNCKSDHTDHFPTVAITEVFDLSKFDSSETNDDQLRPTSRKKVRIEMENISLVSTEFFFSPEYTSEQTESGFDEKLICENNKPKCNMSDNDSSETVCITEDLDGEDIDDILKDRGVKEEDVPLDHSQPDSNSSSNLATRSIEGSSGPSNAFDSDGDNTLVSGNSWACTACTFENNNEVFSCTMCGHSSSFSKLRRSQRDNHLNAGSGTINHGFSLTKNYGSGLTQPQTQTLSNKDLGISSTPRSATYVQSNRRPSSTTSVISYGSTIKSQQSKKRR